jgi:hypothetical protein
VLFATLGQIKRLKRLNLSRNRFGQIHDQLLNPNRDFLQLQDVDLSFNIIDDQRGVFWLTLTKSINVVNITGNPFASSSRGVSNYADFEIEL